MYYVVVRCPLIVDLLHAETIFERDAVYSEDYAVAMSVCSSVRPSVCPSHLFHVHSLDGSTVSLVQCLANALFCSVAQAGWADNYFNARRIKTFKIDRQRDHTVKFVTWQHPALGVWHKCTVGKRLWGSVIDGVAM